MYMRNTVAVLIRHVNVNYYHSYSTLVEVQNEAWYKTNYTGAYWLWYLMPHLLCSDIKFVDCMSHKVVIRSNR